MSYSISDDKVFFQQLYQHEYLYENVMLYSLFRWEDISIKKHCQQALINMIDAYKSVSEFKN